VTSKVASGGSGSVSAGSAGRGASATVSAPAGGTVGIGNASIGSSGASIAGSSDGSSASNSASEMIGASESCASSDRVSAGAVCWAPAAVADANAPIATAAFRMTDLRKALFRRRERGTLSINQCSWKRSGRFFAGVRDIDAAPQQFLSPTRNKRHLRTYSRLRQAVSGV
jgi:hypothetical protein